MSDPVQAEAPVETADVKDTEVKEEAQKETSEERTARIVNEAQTKGVTPPNIKEYAKAIQTADVPKTEGAADKPEDGSLVNEKQPEGQPLTDEHGNPLPELPPLKTEEAK